MTEKIDNIIDKINNKEDLKILETEHYYIYKTLYMFLEDYLKTERLNEKTEEEILQYSNTEIYELKQILNLLLERGILLKSNRKTFDGALIDIYCLSYAYINNIENMIKYQKPEEPKEKKINNTIKSNIEAYKKYNETVLNDLSQIINDFFNFHVEIDNGKIDFQMGGCDYNVYLSRGYIVLEEADNSTIENTWTVEDINEFIDLIKDLKEDN